MKKFFDKAMMWIMAFLMALLLGCALWQVFTRFVLGDPSTFTEELSRFTLIWASMIGAGYAFANNSHMALTLIKDRVQGRTALILNICIELVIWFFMIAVLLYGGFNLCIRNMGQLTPVLRMNKGLIYSCIPLLGVIIGVIKIGQYISWFKNKGKED